MVAGDEHCQLRAVIEVLVPYSSPPSWLADWAPRPPGWLAGSSRPGWLAGWRICPARVRFCGLVLLIHHRQDRRPRLYTSRTFRPSYRASQMPKERLCRLDVMDNHGQ
jgi:hypothetical protein